jgi:hypothetical protein
MTWHYISDLDAFEIYHKVREADTSTSSSTELGRAFLLAFQQACSGSVGTSIANVIVYPLDLVVTRLKVQQRSAHQSRSGSIGDIQHEEEDTQYTSIHDAFRKIYINEGVSGLYTGIVEDTLKSILDSFFLFLFYNLLHRLRRRFPSSIIDKKPRLSATLQVLDSLGIGVLAGAATKALTTPIQNIVTRKQIAAVASARNAGKGQSDELRNDVSVTDMVQKIYKTKGFPGFYSGYAYTLLLTTNPSLTFFLDASLRRLLRRGNDKSPSPTLTFLVAATAKAGASAVTYPLSMAKARAQALAAKASDDTADEHAEMRGKDAAEFPGTNVSPQKKTQRRLNVFQALAQIARTEGPSALYSGVGGEVLKGFFAHGLTILLKERLFGLVLRLWYSMAAILRQRHSTRTT